MAHLGCLFSCNVRVAVMRCFGPLFGCPIVYVAGTPVEALSALAYVFAIFF